MEYPREGNVYLSLLHVIFGLTSRATVNTSKCTCKSIVVSIGNRGGFCIIGHDDDDDDLFDMPILSETGWKKVSIFFMPFACFSNFIFVSILSFLNFQDI